MGVSVLSGALAVAAVAVACGGSGSKGEMSAGDNRDDAGYGADATTPSGFGSGSGGGSSGGFTSSSADGGGSTAARPHECDPSCTAAGGTCAAGLCSITENPANASPAIQAQLKTGGSADPTFAWLYPYDRTVFARGLVSPTLQFAGSAPTPCTCTSRRRLDYKGYFRRGRRRRSNVRALAEGVASHHARRPRHRRVKVAVTKIVGRHGGGSDHRVVDHRAGEPARHHLLRDVRLADPRRGGTVGRLMRSSTPGADAADRPQEGRLRQRLPHGERRRVDARRGDVTITTSASYDLKRTTPRSFTTSRRPLHVRRASTPTAASSCRRRTTWRGFNSHRSSLRHEDRRHHRRARLGRRHHQRRDHRVLAGRQADRLRARGQGRAHAREDGLRRRDQDVLEPRRPGDRSERVRRLAGVHARRQVRRLPRGVERLVRDGPRYGATGDVYTVDIATKTARRLDALDGYTARGPRRTCRRTTLTLSFAPTVLPEAVGGYFWVVFTSHRSYGNLSRSKASSGDQDGKLWVAAVDMNPAPGQDPSHPAFYLDGQELNADNLRGFWVLPPCQQNGTSCSDGRPVLHGLLPHQRRGAQLASPRRAAARTSTRSAPPRRTAAPRDRSASTASAPSRARAERRPRVYGIESIAESTTDEKRLSGERFRNADACARASS